MATINYIIASYAVKNKRKYAYPEDTLKIHLRQLKELQHNLTQITLMKANTGDKEIYEDYYDESLEKEMNLEVHWVENQGYSNGQWLRGYEHRKMEYDYYIFCEDDYVPPVHRFDEILLALYQKKADANNRCFMASLIQGYPKHKMSGNIPVHYEGLVMVSRQSLEELYQYCESDPTQYLTWTQPPFINILPGGREQVNFTTIFRLSGTPILDTIEDGYKFIYWNDCVKDKCGGEIFFFNRPTDHSEIVDKFYYENLDTIQLDKCLCIPIQCARTCVLIAGMHRSGTSAFSGCLNLAGLDYGKNKATVRDKFNNNGYFENMTFLHFNESVLSSMGSHWHDISMLNDLQVETMLKHENRLAENIRKEFSTNHFFIKDPRISLLMPLYLAVLKKLCITVVIVFIDRHNNSISQSLQRAQGVGYDRGMILCNKYKNSLIKYRGRHQLIKFSFENFMDSPASHVQEILNQLQRGEVISEEMSDKINSFINKKQINY